MELAGGDIRTTGIMAQPIEDAGFKAREALLKRAAIRTAKILKWTIGTFIGLAIVVVAAAGYWGWEHRVSGYLTDQRSCTLKVGDYDLSGTRTYSYPYLEIFGQRWIDTGTIDEKTQVQIAGSGMTIIGTTPGGLPWMTVVKDGERGVQILKPADSYGFQIGKNYNAIKYKDFCK